MNEINVSPASGLSCPASGLSCPPLRKGKIVIPESFSEALDASKDNQIVVQNKFEIYSIPEETNVKNEYSNS